MIAVVLTGLLSVVLFGLAARLIVRAGAKPPLEIRTESRRSQAEYAFNRQSALLRKQARLCFLAGGLNLGICVVMGVFEALGQVD